MKKCDFCAYYDPFDNKCTASRGLNSVCCDKPTEEFIRYCNNKERSKNTTKSINKTTIKSNIPYNRNKHQH